MASSFAAEAASAERAHLTATPAQCRRLGVLRTRPPTASLSLSQGLWTCSKCDQLLPRSLIECHSWARLGSIVPMPMRWTKAARKSSTPAAEGERIAWIPSAWARRYDLKLWIAHPFEGAAYLPS